MTDFECVFCDDEGCCFCGVTNEDNGGSMTEFNIEDLDEVIYTAESSLVQMLALQLKKTLRQLEIALPILEQQKRGDGLWEKMGMTEEDKYKIPSMPEEVTAQDMRETLNVPLHEEEAQAAASGFNQCLMECAPIYEAALRGYRGIDECLRELDGMQASLNAKHRSFVTERNRAAAVEAKLAVLEQQKRGDGWIEWEGGEQPVADDVTVKVTCRGGDRFGPDSASRFEWEHYTPGPDNYDIIRYRIIPEQPTNQNGEQ